ncbi:uncharacterized protein LOC131880005 [Tigriopus californicus]|uniref:uncharacterized protein LOC131880005 n=1 Tax=Tigriopus californicus TaxID=6832 RepID=UPI0027DA1D1B|nr:uncharacterized protein LOC131880005 [Tigriopus californicus]
MALIFACDISQGFGCQSRPRQLSQISTTKATSIASSLFGHRVLTIPSVSAMIINLVVVLFLLQVQLAFCYFDVHRWKYIGYQNVWHEGNSHKVQDVKQFTNDPDRSVEFCANFCTLDSTCDAFYLSQSEEGNCHVVDEDSSAIPRTYGHEWRTGKMYYVKESVASNFSDVLPLPDLFEIPCDGDNFTLEASQCDQFPKQNVTYYSCPFSSSRYEDTILEIPDSKCPGEDRLLLCELHGRNIETNVAGNTRTIFEPTFIKTAHNGQGLTVHGLQWLTIQFRQAPKKLSRLIIRTVDHHVERMKFAKLTIHSGQEQDTIDIDIGAQPLGSTCAVLVNFDYTNTWTALNADKLVIHDTQWYGFDQRGFKLDIFVKPPTLLSNMTLSDGCSCTCPTEVMPFQDPNSLAAPLTLDDFPETCRCSCPVIEPVPKTQF